MLSYLNRNLRHDFLVLLIASQSRIVQLIVVFYALDCLRNRESKVAGISAQRSCAGVDLSLQSAALQVLRVFPVLFLYTSIHHH